LKVEAGGGGKRTQTFYTVFRETSVKWVFSAEFPGAFEPLVGGFVPNYEENVENK
jgi:hypothetical protein